MSVQELSTSLDQLSLQASFTMLLRTIPNHDLSKVEHMIAEMDIKIRQLNTDVANKTSDSMLQNIEAVEQIMQDAKKQVIRWICSYYSIQQLSQQADIIRDVKSDFYRHMRLREMR